MFCNEFEFMEKVLLCICVMWLFFKCKILIFFNLLNSFCGIEVSLLFCRLIFLILVIVLKRLFGIIEMLLWLSCNFSKLFCFWNNFDGKFFNLFLLRVISCIFFKLWKYDVLMIFKLFFLRVNLFRNFLKLCVDKFWMLLYDKLRNCW